MGERWQRLREDLEALVRKNPRALLRENPRALRIAGGSLALLLLLFLLLPLHLPEPVVPTRIVGRPHPIAAGADARGSDLIRRLGELRYQEVTAEAPRPGEYRREGRTVRLHRRAFATPEETVPEATFDLQLDWRGRVSTIENLESEPLERFLLDPETVGSVHRGEHVDRIPVALDELPQHLIDAVLVAEDRRFYRHGGLDVRRTVGAFLANLRAGKVVQGGSTLTQQLAKNIYLTPERTFVRKLHEAWLTLRLELGQSKDEILESYLGTIYLGQRGPVSVRGVEAGARHYFGKSARRLSVSESALLAGMIRGPGFYNPFTRPEAALEQRNRVLAMLEEAGRISREQYTASVAEPLGALDDPPDAVSAPWFTARVLRDLAQAAPELEPDREALTVYTSLDAQLQRDAQRAVREQLARLERDFPRLQRPDMPVQAALIALDPDTGAIVAHVGGRDWATSQFDRATQARRQPGSVFKPIVALAALARGADGQPPFTLASLLADEPLTVETPDGGWRPANYSGDFHGEISLRRAIEDSINVPFARLGLALGPERIVATARRLGVASPLEPVPSLALGASEVSPLEMAQAYAVLASGGRLAPVRSWFHVSDSESETRHHLETVQEHAFDPAEVALVTSALEGAIDRGTGRALRARGFAGPVAGKTGTTNDFRDAWFVGYTRTLVVAVWVGFDDGRSIGLTGSQAALPIFADFLIAALGERGGANFELPDGIEQVRVNARTGLRSGFGCFGRTEVFLAGTAPEKSCGWFSKKGGGSG